MASVLYRKAADRGKSLLDMILKDEKFARSIVALVFKTTRLRLKRTSHKPSSVVLISVKIGIQIELVYKASRSRGNGVCFKIDFDTSPESVLSFLIRATFSSNSLRLVADEMSKIEVTEDAGVSDICGGPIYDPRLPGRSHWGPFPSIFAFHQQLRNGVLPNDIRDPESIPQDLRELFLFHQQLWRNPVFRHGDLSSLNILAKGDKVVGIRD
ncbi:hypothetical protein E4U58_000843 [Claviceps cyperi]|nr:hypothetical protein E4U58_000843 [Claviceps cyperi]